MTIEEKKLAENIGKRLLETLYKCDTYIADINASIRNCSIYLGVSYPFGEYIDVCKEMRDHISMCMKYALSAYEEFLKYSTREARLEIKTDEKTE